MSTRPEEVIEFYRQLALLVRANLPLPQSLEKLARNCTDPRFRQTLERLAADTARGVPLADALRAHRDLIPEFFIRLIAAGEKAGTLPEVLFEAAQAARFEYTLAQLVRTVVAYPLFTVGFASGVFLFMLRFVVHDIGGMARELLETTRLPWFSALVFGVADAVTWAWLPCLVLYVVAVGAAVWLFSGRIGAQDSFRRCVAALPGARGILRRLDAARLCGVWSVLMQHRMPFPDALRVSAEMVSEPALATALCSLADDVSAGRALATAAEEYDVLPNLLKLTLAHTPEAELPRELATLRESFMQEATAAAKRVGVLWEVGAIAAMAVAAGGTILALYGPLILFFRRMAE